MVARGSFEGDRMKVGRFRRPQPEIGNLHRGARVPELRRNLVLSVKEERRVEIPLREVHGLYLHRAALVVACANEQSAVVERQLHAVVESARGEEIVVWTEQLRIARKRRIVDCGGKDVFTGGKSANRKFKFRPRQAGRADLAPVKPEPRPKPHALDDEVGVRRIAPDGERAAIAADTTLHAPRRHHVEASRHRHLAVRLEFRRRLRKSAALAEREIPQPVQRQRYHAAAFSREHGERRRQNRAKRR